MTSPTRRTMLAGALAIGLTAGVGGTAAAVPTPDSTGPDAVTSEMAGTARADDGAIDNPGALSRSHQHGGNEGHLLPSRRNVALVGKGAVDDRAEGRVADVEVFGDYAYLGAFRDPDCERGGVYVFDISDLRNPRQINFVDTGENSFVGEGVQVARLRTNAFSGDVLIFNNEVCGATTPTTVGGATLVDVSDPRNPEVLARGFGDRIPDAFAGAGLAHAVHSAFLWTAGHKAYAVLVDDEESRDVDVFDVSDPRRPVKIAEYDLAAMFPQILQEGL
jgi:LVIVD repeat